MSKVASDPVAGPSPLWRRVMREPLVQFAVPAALLFLLDASVVEAKENRIHVTREIVSILEREREAVMGRSLAPEERAELIEEFVEDEVLLREALARGLERGDGKVREHLINKMRFLLEEDAPEPDEQELASFYAEHHELYTLRPTLSLEHVFFEESPADGEALLARLNGGESAQGLGDSFYLGSKIAHVTPEELAVVLGADFTRKVNEIDGEEWHGPIASSRGTHFLRLIDRQGPRLLTREDVEYRLANDWTKAWLERARHQRSEKLLEGYQVVVEDAEGSR